MATATAEGFAQAYGRLARGAVQGAAGGVLCGAIFGAIYEMLKPGSCPAAAAQFTAITHGRPELAQNATALDAAEAIWARSRPLYHGYVAHLLQQVELAMELDRREPDALSLRQASAALHEARRTAAFLQHNGGSAAGLGDAFDALLGICDDAVHNQCLG